TTPPETTSTTPPETTSTTPPETTSTTPPLETSSTGTSTMPPPPGSETPPPTGPPVQTDLLKGPGSSNTVLLATGLAGLGVVFGAGYLMRRRLDD
ncbi:hypothetical protein PZ938_13035, partial [Luteipulveratus sp. YIM 133132]|uniref:hypothetical protein n=1 Tax=Luteipulveratus flavus TaxID=3031728 RepID=UPI0023B0CFE2